MITLDSSNGGFNGVTKDFWTTDLRGGEVVRRYFKALQGGYVIDDDINGGGGIVGTRNVYKTLAISIDKEDVVDHIELFSEGPYYQSDIVNTVNTCTLVSASQYWNSNDEYYNKTQQRIRQRATARLSYGDLEFVVASANLFIDPFINRYQRQPRFIGDPLANGEWIHSPDDEINELAVEKRRVNFPIYKQIAGIDSYFFVDNVQRLSTSEIFEKLQISKISSEVQALASKLIQNKQKFGDFINGLRKHFVVIIKEDDRLKVVFYALGLCGANNIYKEFNYPLSEHNEFIVFSTYSKNTNLDPAEPLVGIAHINSSYKEIEYLKDNGIFKITAPSAFINKIVPYGYRVVVGGNWQYEVEIQYGDFHILDNFVSMNIEAYKNSFGRRNGLLRASGGGYNNGVTWEGNVTVGISHESRNAEWFLFPAYIPYRHYLQGDLYKDIDERADLKG